MAQKILHRIPLRGFIVFLMGWIFLGCAANLPKEAEITQDLPQTFQNTPLISIKSESQTETKLDPTEQIKALFEDSTLNELFDIALNQNLDLQIMNTRILQAKAQLKSAWGALFPSVDGNLNANESHTRTNTTPMQKTQSYTSSVGATLSWEIDLFGRLQHSKNARESLYEKSLQDLENAKITLLGEIATTYLSLLEITQNILLTQENVVHYQNALELTRFKVENGLLDSTELFEKQDMLTNEQNTLESLKSLLEENKNALLVLLDTLEIPFEIESQVTPNIAKELHLDSMPADVLLSRPDIKAALFSLYAQAYTKANAKASLFPILSISANLNDILDSNAQASGNLAWQFASSLSAPILNRTQLTQNYFLQDAILQESYLTLQKSLKTALSEIENTSFNVKSTDLQLQNSQQRTDNAQEYFEFSASRHLVGLIDDLEHALNSASLNNSKKSLNTAKTENLKSFILLYKAFGGDLNLTLAQDTSKP
ncbi:TolC family protein [Helicobacter sp. MIT 05-5294]|uniref:TolC family protein n=1 Tax=Helicobacter sp. MIT 05-5294 TaxID=1548150 RepID=UPI000A6BF02A|nr:TolC family protein [Helicobacter sp. MIT 05-5294]